ncbi:MAG: DUF2508 family protein [Oscillospiraceae bacterium]
MEDIIRSLINFSGIQNREREIDKNSASLIEDINAVSQELRELNTKYNLASDENLIESLIYQELSLKSRYSYLLNEAKRRNVHYEGLYITEN